MRVNIISLSQRRYFRDSRVKHLAGRAYESRLFASSSVAHVPNLINGEFVTSSTSKHINLLNPATDEVIGLVPESTPSEMLSAVSAAKAAFASWKDTSVAYRVRIMLKYQKLLRDNLQSLAENITKEQGKTVGDAIGDVTRGIEVVEHCCSASTLLMGETSFNLSKGLDTYSYRVPLGVCSGIAPFNFPAMIPLWMFPLAITCGNTFILKPSEKDPTTSIHLAKLLIDSGLPKGVLNIIHGSKQTVDFICKNEDIKSISFVGSNTAGEYIFKKGTEYGKRVQANLGAKNHCVVMEDCEITSAVSAVVSAAFGAAGQRCMALPVLILLSTDHNSNNNNNNKDNFADMFLKEVVNKAKELKVGNGFDKSTDIGPLIDKEAKERVMKLIAKGVEQGAKLLLDGRNIQEKLGLKSGNYLGPSIAVIESSEKISSNVLYSEELFAPVLTVLKVKTLTEAVEIINNNKYGNGASIFTSSGSVARSFQHKVQSGQIGLNVPIPVPLPQFSFTGNKASFLGDVNFYGKQGVSFFTQWKTVTSLWNENESESNKWTTSMPVIKN